LDKGKVSYVVIFVSGWCGGLQTIPHTISEYIF